VLPSFETPAFGRLLRMTFELVARPVAANITPRGQICRTACAPPCGRPHEPLVRSRRCQGEWSVRSNRCVRTTCQACGRGRHPYIRKYCAAGDVGLRCFARRLLAVDFSSGCWWHPHRGDRSLVYTADLSCRTTPIDVRCICFHRSWCTDYLAVRKRNWLKGWGARRCLHASASESLRSSRCNPIARAGARASIANVFSRRSSK
jgi:hypothetical protein